MQCRAMNKLCDGLYLILKKWSKLGTGDRFSGSFLQIFRLRPLITCDSRPNLFPNGKAYGDT